MLTTIIYAHPNEDSFNHGILQQTVRTLREQGRPYEVIDLYADEFDPVMSLQELRVYNDGLTSDPLVKKYNEILDATTEAVFIFPIWWYDYPAILKGFFDKVMLAGSAFSTNESGLYPLRHVNKTVIITTSANKTQELIEKYGDCVNNLMIGSTFKLLGLDNCLWFNCECMDYNTTEDRKLFLEQVAQIL